VTLVYPKVQKPAYVRRAWRERCSRPGPKCSEADQADAWVLPEVGIVARKAREPRKAREAQDGRHTAGAGEGTAYRGKEAKGAVEHPITSSRSAPGYVAD